MTRRWETGGDVRMSYVGRNDVARHTRQTLDSLRPNRPPALPEL